MIEAKPVNWVRAPEGATHWDPVDCNWLRQFGGLAFNWLETSGEWVKKGWQYPDELSIMPRLIARSIWSGEGPPPAGTVCELRQRSGGWGEAEIKYISQDVCVWLWVRPDAEVRQVEHGAELRNVEFRPIRTPGQIAAAEARDDAISRMVGFIKDHPSKYPGVTHLSQLKIQEDVCIDLYDAGCRLQVKP
jgi:hypothetical protein